MVGFAGDARVRRIISLSLPCCIHQSFLLSVLLSNNWHLFNFFCLHLFVFYSSSSMSSSFAHDKHTCLSRRSHVSSLRDTLGYSPSVRGSGTQKMGDHHWDDGR